MTEVLEKWWDLEQISTFYKLNKFTVYHNHCAIMIHVRYSCMIISNLVMQKSCTSHGKVMKFKFPLGAETLTYKEYSFNAFFSTVRVIPIFVEKFPPLFCWLIASFFFGENVEWLVSLLLCRFICRIFAYDLCEQNRRLCLSHSWLSCL